MSGQAPPAETTASGSAAAADDEVMTDGAAELAKGPEGMKRLVGDAFERLQPHERQQGHPAWMLHELLSHAPLEAEVWDLLGHALKAARAVGLPPATAGAPGKQVRRGTRPLGSPACWRPPPQPFWFLSSPTLPLAAQLRHFYSTTH